jgi:hypothetical protein
MMMRSPSSVTGTSAEADGTRLGDGRGPTPTVIVTRSPFGCASPSVTVFFGKSMVIGCAPNHPSESVPSTGSTNVDSSAPTRAWSSASRESADG